MPYDTRFLGVTVTAPEAPDPAPGAPVLDYTHFTVAMNLDRRLAWWVAWNIDGTRLFPGDQVSRSGETFHTDPRLPPEQQTTDAVYAGNRLDRGHLARRADLLWGTLEEARAANTDSFTFTNITPQLDDFNQSERGGVWGRLENAILSLDGLSDRRVSLFGGPVLAADDLPYRGLVLVPREFWKVVVYRLADVWRYKAFLLTQDLDRGGLETFLEDFSTYEVPLRTVTARTGLAFPGLDGLEEAPPDDAGDGGDAGAPGARAVLVTDEASVRW